jgi:hypothetical protein
MLRLYKSPLERRDFVYLGSQYEQLVKHYLHYQMAPYLTISFYQSHGRPGDEGIDLRGIATISSDKRDYNKSVSFDMYAFVQCKFTKNNIPSSLFQAFESAVQKYQFSHNNCKNSGILPFLGIFATTSHLTKAGLSCFSVLKVPALFLQLNFVESMNHALQLKSALMNEKALRVLPFRFAVSLSGIPVLMPK